MSEQDPFEMDAFEARRQVGLLRDERDQLRADLAAQKERVEEYKREVERRDEYLRGADADLAAARAEVEWLKARNEQLNKFHNLKFVMETAHRHAAAHMRERCAKVAEESPEWWGGTPAGLSVCKANSSAIAAAIRELALEK